MGLLLLALVALLVRWYWTGRRPTAMLTFLVVLTVLLGWFEFRWQQTEAAANRGAAVVAGEESAGIRCQRLSETLFWARSAIGYVGVDQEGNPEEALLTYEVCTALRSWLESDKAAPSRDEVIAVHVVSHEAAHLTGEFNEAIAECLALKYDADVAVAMGATREQAEALAFTYRVEVYPTLRSEYLGVTAC